MDILASTAETAAALRSYTANQLLHTTLEANRAHQYALEKYADRLTTEFQDVDRLLEAVEQNEAEKDCDSELQVEGGHKPIAPILASDLFNADSPFLEEASKRLRYANLTTVHPMKPKELETLADAVQSEHRRLEAIEAQKRGEGLPSATGLVDFDRNKSDIDWTIVAEKVTDASNIKRTPDECRIKWLGDRHPRVNRSDWTKSEIERLKEIVRNRLESGPVNWVEIAKALGTNRVPIDCLRNSTQRKRHTWDDASDKRLADGVRKHGFDNWNLVACYVSEDATGVQCQSRYARIHDSTQKRGAWSEAEDKRLALAVAGFGNTSWVEVASTVPGRTNEQCRDRWLEVKVRKEKNVNWTKEQEEKLLDAVNTLGKKWRSVSVQLGGTFTETQCRLHYTKLQKRIDTTSPSSASLASSKAALFSRAELHLRKSSTPGASRSPETIRHMSLAAEEIAEEVEVAPKPRPKPKAKPRKKKDAASATATTDAAGSSATGQADGSAPVDSAPPPPPRPRPKPKAKPKGKGKEKAVEPETAENASSAGDPAGETVSAGQKRDAQSVENPAEPGRPSKRKKTVPKTAAAAAGTSTSTETAIPDIVPDTTDGPTQAEGAGAGRSVALRRSSRRSAVNRSLGSADGGQEADEDEVTTPPVTKRKPARSRKTTAKASSPPPPPVAAPTSPPPIGPSTSFDTSALPANVNGTAGISPPPSVDPAAPGPVEGPVVDERPGQGGVLGPAAEQEQVVQPQDSTMASPQAGDEPTETS